MISKAKRITLPIQAIEWLRTGERGVSSEGIFSHLTGVPIYQWRPSPPTDPSDFRRCCLLVQAVPSFRSKLHRMAELGSQWKAIVDHWDELCAIMDEEIPKGTGSASRLWDRMGELVFGRKPSDEIRKNAEVRKANEVYRRSRRHL